MLTPMTFYWGAIFGVITGFGFGVGCSLAVLYSIYLGGYRAAVRDGSFAEPPERLLKAQAKLML